MFYLKYFVFVSSCPNAADGTVVLSNETSTHRLFHWKAQSFRFFGASDAVYFACDVVVCESSNQANVCERCQSSSRRRRELGLMENDDGQVESAMTVFSTPYILIEGKYITSFMRF